MTFNALECPIKLTIMTDPVLGTDGHTYERDAITNWLTQHGTSPQTRERMSVDNLVPNRAIAHLLEQNALAAAQAGIHNEDEDKTAIHDEDKDDTDSNITTKTDAKGFSSEELAIVTLTTKAAVHIVHNNEIAKKEPLSARVHIQTPNPTVNQVDRHLTTPNHICCVIDISGSMALPATSKDESGNAVEDNGLTILDVVKFATLVIAESLNAQDKLSIVTYSDDANIALQPTNMTSDGKQKVKSALACIMPTYRTNLFAGLKCGIEQAHGVGKEYVNSVYILTDGVPNVHPSLGYGRAIDKVLSKTPVFGTVSTFGFGYNLDSKLLVDIANLGGGYYSFIPDAGMVGTCFINALANSRCIYGVHPTLKISGCNLSLLVESDICDKAGDVLSLEFQNKCSTDTYNEKEVNTNSDIITGVTLDGCLETKLVGNDIYVKLTPLRYGSDVDIMLKPALFKKDDGIKIELSFNTVGGNTIDLSASPSNGDTKAELLHSKRSQFVNKAFNLCFSPFEQSNCSMFVDAAKDSAAGNSKLDALYQDMKGQATEAIASDSYFSTWGKHFLLSLSMAHLHQFCNNFKDPGVQIYGIGTLFKSLQDRLDDTFEKVPPPKPSGRNFASRSSAPVQMTTVFNNRNAVCVHRNTMVTVKVTETMVDHTNATSLFNSSRILHVPIYAIKKGDFVLTANKTYAKVECLVETVADSNTLQTPFELIKVGKLCVTPYHPIKLNQASGWQFPINVAQSKWMVPTDDQYATAYSVYNLVLESANRHEAVLMDGIASITLGHGVTDNAILQHTYFGTNEVISDLKRVDNGRGWEMGHVVLRETDVKRNGVSGCIYRMSGTQNIADEELKKMNTMYSCTPCAG